MKKVNLALAVLFISLLALGVKGQLNNEKDYFLGKWSVLVVGTPNGDAKMVLSLERVDGKLKGSISRPDLTEPTKLTSATETGKDITVNWTSSDYDVYMVLEKKGDNHLEGSLMNMFDAKGDRIIEEKAK